MFVPSFVRWRPSRHSIALAIALLQINVKPWSKHTILNILSTFFITSFTSCFFLTKINSITILLAPYDLHFFPNVYYSLCKIFNLNFAIVELINIVWANINNEHKAIVVLTITSLEWLVAMHIIFDRHTEGKISKIKWLLE